MLVPFFTPPNLQEMAVGRVRQRNPTKMLVKAGPDLQRTNSPSRTRFLTLHADKMLGSVFTPPNLQENGCRSGGVQRNPTKMLGFSRSPLQRTNSPSRNRVSQRNPVSYISMLIRCWVPSSLHPTYKKIAKVLSLNTSFLVVILIIG